MTASRTRNLGMETETHGRQIVRVRGILCIVLLLTATGCRSLNSEGGLFADRLSIDGIRGPLERTLVGRNEDPLEAGVKFTEQGRQEVEVARRLFDEGKYEAAIKSYRRIAGKYEKSAIGEEAWYRIGEANFAMKKYSDAHDAYEKLYADYPSTKYVSDVSGRLFAIARSWLEVAEPAVKEDLKEISNIKTVGQTTAVEDVKTESRPSDPSARWGLIPNFFDRTRPFLDTRGQAVKALRAIWLNDPTGPLADDALMLTASYYLKRENYMEADRYLERLREDYPDSPHLENAFVLGTHVKQMSYQGPLYDDTALVAAENLSERSLMLFPNSGDRDKMRDSVKRAYALKAQRAWAEVDFWRRKDNTTAIAIQCRELIEEFPETRYADLARTEFLNIPPSRYEHLPEMKAFAEQLRNAGPSPANAQPRNAAPPVKSVSEPRSRFNPFRLLGR